MCKYGKEQQKGDVIKDFKTGNMGPRLNALGQVDLFLYPNGSLA